MTATILLTGATGFIGFRILLAALDAGHNVRYTVRSEEKAKVVYSNPAIQKLSPGDRLSSVVIPDFTVDGAFDSALKGVTHIIHTGSPVPMPYFEPMSQVFRPTIKITSGLLSSALKTPSIHRVVITSSIVANLGFAPTTTAVSAWTRVPLPNPLPTAFSNVFEAYIMAKSTQLHIADEFVEKHHPHFAVAHVTPGYVFGRNELALDAKMMQEQNSSNNLIVMAITGQEPPFPMHDGFVHIDDAAETHLRVLFLDSTAIEDGPKDFGLSTKVDYMNVFGIVEKAFPKSVAAGIFKKGNIIPIPVEYDSSDAVKLLGGKVKSFETAVLDIASQYLEILGVEKE